MALRSPSIGTDTQLYIGIYNRIGYYGFNYIHVADMKGMYLYFIYNLLIYKISSEPQMLVICNALIINFLGCLALWRLSGKHLYLASLLYILMYFYFTWFNTSRAAIAILLVVNSTYYLKNNKKFKYLLFMLMAVFVHFTALVGFIHLFYKIVPKNKKGLFIVAVVSVAIAVASIPIMTWVANNVDDYSAYSDRIETMQSVGRSLLLVACNLIVLLFLLIVDKKYKKIDWDTEFDYIASFLFSIVLGIFAARYTLLARINSFFSVYAVFIIPRAVDMFVKKEKIFIGSLVIAVYLVEFIFLLQGNYSGIIDYKLFFT